jgi:isoleucyl-tRNA synthetase
MAEVAITSDLTLRETPAPDGAFAVPEVAGVGVVVEAAEGGKCQRCWRVLPEVDDAHEVCGRCDDALRRLDAAAQ